MAHNIRHPFFLFQLLLICVSPMIGSHTVSAAARRLFETQTTLSELPQLASKYEKHEEFEYEKSEYKQPKYHEEYPKHEKPEIHKEEKQKPCKQHE